MRIFILTQNDNQYLPAAIAEVCRNLQEEIVCLVTAPPMLGSSGKSFHNYLKHMLLFGVRGTFILGLRILRSKLRGLYSSPGPNGPFYSLKNVADTFAIPYYEMNLVNSPEFLELVEQYEPDLLVSMSCPQIIKRELLDRFSMGSINVHGSPLPRYRGTMPAFWVLRNGEAKTATTVHDLDIKLDNGSILIQKEVKVMPDDTWDSLVKKTKAAGAEALIEAVTQIKAGTVKRKPNKDEDATFISFPTPEDRKAFLASGRRFF